jgi:hypothetical protein
MLDTYEREKKVQCQMQCLVLAMESACCPEDFDSILCVLENLYEEVAGIVSHKREEEPYDPINEELKRFTQGFGYKPPNCS